MLFSLGQQTSELQSERSALKTLVQMNQPRGDGHDRIKDCSHMGQQWQRMSLEERC